MGFGKGFLWMAGLSLEALGTCWQLQVQASSQCLAQQLGHVQPSAQGGDGQMLGKPPV